MPLDLVWKLLFVYNDQDVVDENFGGYFKISIGLILLQQCSQRLFINYRQNKNVTLEEVNQA